MPEYQGIEWLNANESRNYPLDESATSKDQSGDFELPNDFLVGLYLPVPLAAVADPEKFYLQSIAVDGMGAVLTIGYDDDSSDPPTVASASVSRSLHTPYRAYNLVGTGDFFDVVGSIQVGRFDSLDDQPTGLFIFDYEGGQLDVDCIRPNLRGISSIRVRNNGVLSDRYYGDVTLTAGSNQRISVEIGSDGVPAIRLDAIGGEGLNESCSCDGAGAESQAGKNPIRFINMVPPNSGGNSVWVGDRCFNIEPIENGIKLTNRCAQPCLGCSDLDPFLSALETIRDQEVTMLNLLAKIEKEQDLLKSSLFGGMMSDQICDNCT